MLSIVIPTLNEEKYLPQLLNSLTQQTIPHEIIVADAHSTDKTVEIAWQYGAKVVEGGRPARARNNGWRAAQGDQVLFLDADVVLRPGALDRLARRFEKQNLTWCTVRSVPLSWHPFDRSLGVIGNGFAYFSQKLRPWSAGYFIWIRKSALNTLGGFNEKLKVSEDYDLIERLSHIPDVRHRYYWTPSLRLSFRRYEVEGRWPLVKKYLRILWNTLTNQHDKNADIEYQFAHYDAKK